MDKTYKSGSEQELVDNLATLRITGASLTNFLAGLVDNTNFANIEVPLREALKKYNHRIKTDKEYIQ